MLDEIGSFLEEIYASVDMVKAGNPIMALSSSGVIHKKLSKHSGEKRPAIGGKKEISTLEKSVSGKVRGSGDTGVEIKRKRKSEEYCKQVCVWLWVSFVCGCGCLLFVVVGVFCVWLWVSFVCGCGCLLFVVVGVFCLWLWVSFVYGCGCLLCMVVGVFCLWLWVSFVCGCGCLLFVVVVCVGVCVVVCACNFLFIIFF